MGIVGAWTHSEAGRGVGRPGGIHWVRVRFLSSAVDCCPAHTACRHSLLERERHAGKGTEQRHRRRAVIIAVRALGRVIHRHQPILLLLVSTQHSGYSDLHHASSRDTQSASRARAATAPRRKGTPCFLFFIYREIRIRESTLYGIPRRPTCLVRSRSVGTSPRL